MLRNKLLFGGYLVIMAIAQILGTGFAFVMSSFIDAVSKSIAAVKEIFIMGCIYVLICVLFETLYSFIKNKIVMKTRESLKEDLFKAIMSREYEIYYKENSASYLNELSNNIILYEATYINTLLVIPTLITMFLTASISCIIVEPRMLLIIVVLGFLTLFVSKITAQPLEKYSGVYIDSTEKYMTEIKDDFTGYGLIHNFGVLSTIILKHNKLNHCAENNKYKSSNRETFCIYTGELVGLFSTVFIMGVASLLAAKGFISVGLIIAFGHLCGQIISPITQIPSMYANYKASLPLTKRFEEILESAFEDVDSEEVIFQDKIQINQLSFAYETKMIYNSFNLIFEKGKKIAVVGKSGCGKTTLFHLLLGHYRNYSGQIFFDQKDYMTMSASQLEKVYGIVNQETFLFNDSLYNNITMFDNRYSQNKIERVIRDAGLETFVKSLPQGLDTIINENGKNISGGEKQRIGLSRLLLSNKEIMLFDEPTANLDQITSSDIYNHILSIPDKSVIVITHSSDEKLLSRFDALIRL